MLTLILARHAEASVLSENGDHSRELSGRGLVQAVAAGETIKGWGFTPSLCVSSDARRAAQTAGRIAETCGISQGCVVYANRLYESYTTQEFVEIVASAVAKSREPDADCVVVVGHNPDVTYKADALSRVPLKAAFPTAGVVALLFDVDDWSELSARAGTILRSSFF